MVFPFGNPKQLHTKEREDYLAAGILTIAFSILQGGLINTTKEKGVISERSRYSARARSLSVVMFLPCPSTNVQHLLAALIPAQLPLGVAPMRAHWLAPPQHPT
jgi:hypothetical protein